MPFTEAELEGATVRKARKDHRCENMTRQSDGGAGASWAPCWNLIPKGCQYLELPPDPWVTGNCYTGGLKVCAECAEKERPNWYEAS